MLVSDTFSRSHLSHYKPKFAEISLINHIQLHKKWIFPVGISSFFLWSVHFVLFDVLISETCWKQFNKKLKTTPLCKLHSLHPYYTHPRDTKFCKDILLKNERIKVPTTHRAEIKPITHHEHLGIENRKRRVRQSLFWPLINSDIEDMIKKCPTCCLTFQKWQLSESIRSFLFIWASLFTNYRLLLQIYCGLNATIIICYK